MVVNLRVKTSSKQTTLRLDPSDTISKLCSQVDVSFGVNDTKVLKGFPPRPIEVSDPEATISDLGIASGDVIMIEKCKQDKVLPQIMDQKGGILMRETVDSDNSCLFTSINFCLSGKVNKDKNDLMREIIANTLEQDPFKYNAAILGRENSDYRKWILNPDSWGGAIEVQILAEYFGVEISVHDTKSNSVTNFGEELGAGQRMLLIYDGIHYDPLYLDPLDGSNKRTLHPLDDADVVQQAKQLAQEAQNAKQFTDVNNFTLKCTVCSEKLTGQTDAQAHAKKTGHTSFGEV